MTRLGTSFCLFVLGLIHPTPSFAQESNGPKRVVVIGPNAAEVICGLGACDRIIAVDKYCVFPPELANRPLIGGLFDADIERIVALKPDLVVLRGRKESVEELCRQQKISLFWDKTENLADITTTVLDLSTVFSRETEGRKLIAEFRQRLNAIEKRVAGKPRPRVLLTVGRRPDHLSDIMTAGKGSFLDEMIRIAGGENLFGDVEMPYPQISTEAIIAKQPDVIVELVPELELTRDLREEMTNGWKKLAPLPATKTGRIYFLDDKNALIPSPRYVEIVEKVSRLLHPDASIP
ncbi:MAG: helical backbone metal receptor [Planctomycetota bacterium]